MENRHTLDELINILGEVVADGWSMPLSGGKVVLERDRLMELIAEIKNVMPGDLMQARAIVESRNELAAAARRDADSIIRSAEEKAHRLVEESAILTEARKAAKELADAATANARSQVANAETRARQIVSDAETHAAEVTATAEKRSRDLKNATTAFISDSLARSEESVTGALNELRKVRGQFAGK